MLGHCHFLLNRMTHYFLVPPWFDLELRAAKRGERKRGRKKQKWDVY